MKIIYCLAGTFNSGGMERIVIKKANWFVQNGYEVVIVTTEQQGRPHFFSFDSRIRCIDLNINYSDNSYDGNIISKYRIRRQKLNLHKYRLTELLRQEKPDITISTYGNEVNFLYKIKDGSKKIVEIHFSRWFRLQCEQPSILYNLANKYLTCRDKWLVKRYNAFVCLTQEDRSNWGNLDNISVIPNFIEPIVVEHTILSNKQVISVGRLSFQKGYDRLIQAWKIVHESCPDWGLKIFGGGELKGELLQLISDLNLTEVVQICEPTKDIYREYKKSAMFVLSSRYEGLPMVLLEAMQCGLPIISYACQCGPRDLIEDGINGVLVPEGDICQLAHELIQLMKKTGQQKRMGRKSYLASLQYDINVIMPKWVLLFESI